MIDPASVISLAGVGLKLVDQFRETYLRWRGGKVEPVSATVVQVKDELQVQSKGAPPHVIKASDLRMDEWDEVQYHALEKRVKFNWNYFHGLAGEAPSQSTDERVKLELKMDRIKGELCTDFRQMVRIYERVLGLSLPDHYQLYEVCGN